MNTEQKKERGRHYYDDVWCNGKLGIVDELFAPSYENCDPATPGGTIKGKDAFKSFVSSYREAFPDLRLDIIDQYCDGDTVVSRWHASGTHRGALMGIPATGKSAKGWQRVSSRRSGRCTSDGTAKARPLACPVMRSERGRGSCTSHGASRRTIFSKVRARPAPSSRSVRGVRSIRVSPPSPASRSRP